MSGLGILPGLPACQGVVEQWVLGSRQISVTRYLQRGLSLFTNY